MTPSPRWIAWSSPSIDQYPKSIFPHHPYWIFHDLIVQYNWCADMVDIRSTLIGLAALASAAAR